jgi:flagellar motor switch protein FliM
LEGAAMNDGELSQEEINALLRAINAGNDDDLPR